MNNINLNKKNNNSTLKLEIKNEVPILVFDKLKDIPFINHLFTTRLGGHSKGIFSTMNFALNTGDNKEDVYNNFNEIAKIFDITIDDFYHAYQNHTSNVKVVKDDDRGKGVTRETDDGEYDAFITNCRKLAIYVSVADCVPIFIVDTKNKAIGLVHAGWRGTLNNIIKNTIDMMKLEFNTDPKDIIACIGPSICEDCYEVSKDLYDAFSKSYSDNDINLIFKEENNDKYKLNLHLANKINLMSSGVLENNIDITNLCTYENLDIFFSHRRLGFKRGNNAGFIMIN